MQPERLLHPQLEDRPLFFIKDVIERKFEGDVSSWKDVEPEVILHKLKDCGFDITSRLMAKVKIILFLQEHSGADLLEDPLRVIYAAEVINNEDSVFDDPEFIPHVSSMEMAYFIKELEHLGQMPKPENVPYEFKTVCSYCLKEEGFYEPPAPFSFLVKSDLYPFEMKNDMPATDQDLQSQKQQGIDKYLQLMSKLEK